MTNRGSAIAERLAQLDTIALKHGGHKSVADGMCAMEAVAWLAGEKHSDAPACACPVIARAMIRLNDRISDGALRTELLRPLLPKVIGTRSTLEVMVKRGYVAADMAVRVFAPMALEKRGRLDLAEMLRGCAPIVDKASAEAGRDKSREVRTIAAADAAYAADAAAYAAADAAADAAYADYADAADARKPVYLEAVRMIERMCACTE